MRFGRVAFKLQVRLTILSVGRDGTGWACINNLCPPLKIIDQVCLFAVVAFNLLAAEVPKATTELQQLPFHCLPLAAAERTSRQKSVQVSRIGLLRGTASWPALGVIEIILSEKSAFKKYFNAHTNVSMRSPTRRQNTRSRTGWNGMGVQVWLNRKFPTNWYCKFYSRPKS